VAGLDAESLARLITDAGDDPESEAAVPLEIDPQKI
jgi:hypothetical protein